MDSSLPILTGPQPITFKKNDYENSIKKFIYTGYTTGN